MKRGENLYRKSVESIGRGGGEAVNFTVKDKSNNRPLESNN